MSNYKVYTQQAHLPFSCIMMPKGYIAQDVSVFNAVKTNAIKVLANLLLVAIRQYNVKLYLIQFYGGESADEIPAAADAKVAIPKEDIECFEELVEQCNMALQPLAATDPDIRVENEEAIWHGKIMSEESTHVLLASINAVPVGDITTDEQGDALIFNNIGEVEQNSKSFSVTIQTKIAVGENDDTVINDNIVTEISQIFSLVGAEVKTETE